MDNDVITIVDKIIDLLVSLLNPEEDFPIPENTETIDKIAEKCEMFIQQLRAMLNEMYSDKEVQKQEKHLKSLVIELHGIKREIVNIQKNLEHLQAQIEAVDAEIEERNRDLSALNSVVSEQERKLINMKLFLTKSKEVARKEKKKFTIVPKRISIPPPPSRDIVLHLTPTLESIGEKTEEDLNEDSPRASTISTIEEDFRSMDCLDEAF